MAVVGQRFQCDEIFVPEMLISANAMKACLAILEPLIAESGSKPPHTAIIGTVQGDLHDIGKNLVGMMWRGANIAVVDLGVNVSPAVFASAAQEHSLTSWVCPPPDHDDAVHARGGPRDQGHR
jgi:5-methyltetrahydrofolate--homocysteine methyltransferase